MVDINQNEAQNCLIIISASLLNNDWKKLIYVATITNIWIRQMDAKMFTKWTQIKLR